VAAGGRDVRISGGAEAVRQYLEAGLVDEPSIHLAPILMGKGVRLFGHLAVDRLKLEPVDASASPGVTHLRIVSQRDRQGADESSSGTSGVADSLSVVQPEAVPSARNRVTQAPVRPMRIRPEGCDAGAGSDVQELRAGAQVGAGNRRPQAPLFGTTGGDILLQQVATRLYATGLVQSEYAARPV
jgi:hypothetical protein